MCQSKILNIFPLYVPVLDLKSLTCPSRSSWEIRRMWTGPGPQWASGGDTVAVRLGSEASGRLRVSGGNVRVQFTCTGQEAILLKPCTERDMQEKAEQWKHERGHQLMWVSGRIFDPAYSYKARLCEVPEGLPELHVQILGNAFKLRTPQLWIHDVFPWCEEGEGCHTWKKMDDLKHEHNLLSKPERPKDKNGD